MTTDTDTDAPTAIDWHIADMIEAEGDIEGLAHFYARSHLWGSFIKDLKESLAAGDLEMLASDIEKLEHYHQQVRRAHKMIDTILESCALAHLTEAAREVIETAERGDPIEPEMIENMKEAVNDQRLRAVARFLRAHSS